MCARNFREVPRRRHAYLMTIVLSGVISGLTACTGIEIDTPVTKLVAQDYAELLAPESFVKQVLTINTRGNTLFMNDEGATHILCVDTELNVVGTIGTKGDGPGEFPNWPHTFDVTDNNIYAYASNRRLQVFSHQGEYKRAIRPPVGVWANLAVDIEENVYLSHTASEFEFPIIKLDSSGTVVNNFGDLLVTDGFLRRKQQLSRRRLVVLNDQYLMTIGVAVPVVEKYSLDGELIAHNDLSQEPFFTHRLSYPYEMEESANEAGGSLGLVTVVQDVAVTNSMFYVLVIQGAPGQDLRTNTILAVDTETLTLEHAYELSDLEGKSLRWVNAFARSAFGELLVYHHSEGVFYRYRHFEQT